MPLRNQPYLPLYVDDFQTDERLRDCSATSTGVYIRIMCVMHKSEQYGKILLKQKHKQTTKQIENFARLLAKHLPYDLPTILLGLQELVDENILQIEGDTLFQKRMVKDSAVSDSRSLSGKKGGNSTQKKNSKFAKPKNEANSGNEYGFESGGDLNGKGDGLEEPLPNEVTYPWDSEVFVKNWSAWKQYRIDGFQKRFANASAEQAALMDLSRMAKTENKAIELIQKAMSNNWQNLGDYDKKNGKGNSIENRDRANDNRTEELFSSFGSRKRN